MKVAGKTSRGRASADAAGGRGKTRAGREDHQERVLRERAMAAMDRAYAPYSAFHVGAALLGTDGSVAEACNVENAAFPAGTCAERAALASAVARGVRTFQMLAIATTAEEPTPPCGMCRQALIEFSPELEIVSVTRGGKEGRWRLADLLPHAFSPRSLTKTTD
ncbi:MAG TPA: cytidine deaminase [Gemmatimonadaceae bacterium]|nr:cytidine deaminase [Gemmatimonadaceae bacterium]